MKTKITQYGYPGDPYWDTLTKQGWGAWGNRLTPDGCALTNDAKNLLGVNRMDWVIIDFKDGTAPMARQFQDRAPEEEPRVDLYMPDGFNHRFPDFAEVTKL